MTKKGFLGVLISGLVCFLIIGAGYLKTRSATEPSDVVEPKKTTEVSSSSQESDEDLKEDRGKIVYSPMGDSLTEGFYASTSDKRFVEVYAKMLEDKLGYEVDVQGVAGYGGTTTNGVKGLDEIEAQNPDLVTIAFGTNDADPNNGSSIDTFIANLDLMIQTVTNINGKSPKVVLVTTWNQGDKAQPFDDAIKAAGEKYNLPVADISDIWQDSTNKGPEGVETFKGTSDNWHPNDAGMQKIAERIYEVSESIFK